jgi:DNA-binding MarR family transcriptional regulator
MENPLDSDRELTLLDQIERDPDVTQASLASMLGVAVGTVNWHLKRLVAKGYVKVKRAQRRKLRYIITPEGLALRARLTVNYIETSMQLYRKTRERVGGLLDEARAAGYNRVRIMGEGDIAEICRLTCLEQNIQVVDDPGCPTLAVHGVRVFLEMPEAARV